jgi:hypothetical protein
LNNIDNRMELGAVLVVAASRNIVRRARRRQHKQGVSNEEFDRS